MDLKYELATHAAEETNWWYRGRRRILAGVIGSLPLPSPARVLDAGCGSGRNLVELQRWGPVTGLEPAGASLALARGRGVGEVVDGSLDERLPFADDSFELLTCLDVIEHLDEDRDALLELRRVAAPGGRLVVTVPAYPLLWGQHDLVNHHRRRYTRSALLAAAAAAGWRPERVTCFNTVLLPAAFVVRLAQRLRPRRDPDASDLDLVPQWLDGALGQILAAEGAAIARGHDLPAGLSLLAVFI